MIQRWLMIMDYRSRKIGLKFFLFLLILLLGIPSTALAYIDPNTGNLIFQILFPIITAIVTGYLLCKNYIARKFKALMARLGKQSCKENDGD
jgi:hypothetical protein